MYVVNGQQSKLNAGNGKSPENQCGQQSKCQEEVVKVLTFVVTAVTIELMGVPLPRTGNP